MPLYDCMLLLKPHIKMPDVMDLVSRVGKHIYQRNGVLTELKSLGTVHLGYGIKKLDGRHFQVSPFSIFLCLGLGFCFSLAKFAALLCFFYCVK